MSELHEKYGISKITASLVSSLDYLGLVYIYIYVCLRACIHMCKHLYVQCTRVCAFVYNIYVHFFAQIFHTHTHTYIYIYIYRTHIYAFSTLFAGVLFHKYNPKWVLFVNLVFNTPFHTYIYDIYVHFFARVFTYTHIYTYIYTYIGM